LIPARVLSPAGGNDSRDPGLQHTTSSVVR
jgi:hypothetical protein